MGRPSSDPSYKTRSVLHLHFFWEDIQRVISNLLPLIGEHCRHTQSKEPQWSQQKKNVKKEEPKGDGVEENSSCQHTKQAEDASRDLSKLGENEALLSKGLEPEFPEWRQTQQKPQCTEASRMPHQEKIIKMEGRRGGDIDTNIHDQQTTLAESIDGARPSSKTAVGLVQTCIFSFFGVFKNLVWCPPVGDTSQNDIEKKQPDVKTKKIGQQRQVLKKGKRKHYPQRGKNHGGLKFILIILLGRSCCAMTLSVPPTKITPSTEPRMMETLPPACTDAGSKRNDTWLDKKDVKSNTISGVFHGSYKGYTKICPNAFDGLELPIREMRLTGNNLTELPDGLCRNLYDVLHRIYIDYNQLTYFPIALNECPDIEFICISYNDIKEIPRGTINITSLHSLDASGNVNLSQYPQDLFYLPNLRIVFFKNTSISSLPVPPFPSSGVYLKCEEYIVTLVRESGKLQFDMENTDALSPKNWEVKIHGDPEGMVVPYDCTNNSFGPFYRVENRSNATKPQTDFNDSTTTPSPMTLHDSALNAKPQNDFNAGVLLLVISVVIFVICIYRLCLIAKGNGKDGSPRLEIVGLFVVAVVMIIVTFFVARHFFGLGEALILAGGAVVALTAVFVYSYYISKKNKDKA